MKKVLMLLTCLCMLLAGSSQTSSGSQGRRGGQRKPSAPSKSKSAKPDFSGEWKIMLDQSRFLEMLEPTALVYKIEHRDPNLKVTVTMTMHGRDSSETTEYRTDGTDLTQKRVYSVEKIQVTWEALTLVFHRDRQTTSGIRCTDQETWQLSEAGKRLTTNLRQNCSGYDPNIEVLVFEKK